MRVERAFMAFIMV